MFGKKKESPLSPEELFKAREAHREEVKQSQKEMFEVCKNDKPAPDAVLIGGFEEEFLPDIRKQWLETSELNSCGIHRNCSLEDIIGVDSSLEDVNLLAGTLTRNEETGEVSKAWPAHSDKFKNTNHYNLAELKKGYTRKQLEAIIAKIVTEVIYDLED